jgi:deoxyribonuclease V
VWPETADELASAQRALADERPQPWRPAEETTPAIGGCWVCFPRGKTGAGDRGDPAWAAAVTLRGARLVASAVVAGEAGAPYEPGLLALREGLLLETAVRALPERPGVVLVDATGRDHPRRAGLAHQLGAVLDLPTVGVTHRPLLAEGPEPADAHGARADLRLDGEMVACALRTRAGARPLAVHPAWRTDLETAVAVVLAATRGRRTPEPLRLARRLAREARARVGA